MAIQSFQSIGMPIFAIAEGATTPNPGLNVWVWSSSVGRPMYWNGTLWTSVPTSGGGGSPGGSSGQVQWNNGGAFAGATSLLIDGDELTLPEIATPSNPSANRLKLFSQNVLGRTRLQALDAAGNQYRYERSRAEQLSISWEGQPGSAGMTSLGQPAMSAAGTLTAAALSNTSAYTRTPRVDCVQGTASTTAVGSLRAVNGLVTIGGSVAGRGGFAQDFIGGPAAPLATASTRFFMGYTATPGAPTDVEPSSRLNTIGIGYDSADANLQVMHNDGAGTATKINLGANFAVPTTDRSKLYWLELASPPGTTQSVQYRVTDIIAGFTASGTITTDLPSTATFIMPQITLTMGGTSGAPAVTLVGCWVNLPSYVSP